MSSKGYNQVNLSLLRTLWSWIEIAQLKNKLTFSILPHKWVFLLVDSSSIAQSDAILNNISVSYHSDTLKKIAK